MRSVALVLLAACSFRTGELGTTQYAPAQIVDNTAADFAAGEGEDCAIDPLGTIGPDAFIYNGLHARAYGSTPVTATTKWSDLTPAVLGPQAGERYGEAPITDWSTSHPRNLGLLYHDDNFTIVYDGEIYLPAGPIQLQLASDDDGFVEIDLGAIRVTIRANASTVATQTITAPAAGWYPIHGAMTEIGVYAKFVVSTAQGPLTPDHFRARVTTAHGALVTAVPSRMFMGAIAGESLEPTILQHDFAGYPPTYDFPGINATVYGLRYTGQLHIDENGPHVFSIDIGSEAGDYARLMIDGRSVAGHWPSQVEQPSTTIALTPGWHDLLLDYAQQYNAEHVTVLMTTPTRAAAPIPPEALRPVRTMGLLTANAATDFSLVDATDAQHPGVATASFVLTAPVGAVVDFIDVLFEITSETRSDLSVQIVQPAGVDAMPMPATPAYDGGLYDYMADHTMLAGAPVAGAWQGVFTDSVPTGSAGHVYYPYLIASYHGGPNGPFAMHAVYTSAPHATPGLHAIDAIKVAADLHGATLMIEVRTSLDGSWTAVENGGTPAVDPGDLVQYRLTLDGDGWQAASIDAVELDVELPE